MRRRRHTLQVSTFPFLAVLLCAMGSLILLLLVLDRRAKVVARAKERERQEAVLAQHSKADQERMREYEQKRLALRQKLRAQEAALHANVDSVQAEVRRKKQETLQERSRTAELQARLSALREILVREQEGYEQEQRRTASLSTKKRAVLSEHEALARELMKLENALVDVIAFRKRQAQTYSLVPFLGKSSENRRPIYVECQADQIIVHPERMIAKTNSWDGTNPVQELADKLASRLKANAEETKQKPYVLFLIRPEGIATYYLVLGALGVRNIDSGYELIDADWALDFGESDGHAPAQPWAADPRTPSPGVLAGALPASPRLTGPVRGVPQNGIELLGRGGPGDSNVGAKPQFGAAPVDGQRGVPGNGYGTGGGQGPTALSDLLKSPDASGGRAVGNEHAGMTAAGQSSSPPIPGSGVAPPGLPGSAGGAGPNTGDSRVAFTESDQKAAGGTQRDQKLLPIPGQDGQFGSPVPPQMAGNLRVGPASASNEAGLNGVSSNGSSGYAPNVGGATNLAGSGEPAGGGTGVPGGAAAGSPNSGANGEMANGVAAVPDSPNSSPSGEIANNVPGAAGGSGAASPEANASKQPMPGQSIVLTPGAARPASSDSGGGASVGSGGDAASVGSGASQGLDSGDGTGGGSGGGTPAPPDPLARLLPKTKRPPAPASFRMEGNRDLPIVLECRADEVVFTPTDRHWQVTDLERDSATRIAFADSVQQWIARRQATVREGQTPYRPLVRFRVNPDGLRTYYAAYPLLERLGVPMKRENVESRPPPMPRVRPE
jgi:hypothetical protein